MLSFVFNEREVLVQLDCACMREDGCTTTRGITSIVSHSRPRVLFPFFWPTVSQRSVSSADPSKILGPGKSNARRSCQRVHAIPVRQHGSSLHRHTCSSKHGRVLRPLYAGNNTKGSLSLSLFLFAAATTENWRPASGLLCFIFVHNKLGNTIIWMHANTDI